MNQMLTLDLSHRFHYSNREPVPIADVASSLVALERILLRVPKVLTLVTGVQIDGVEIYIEDIRSGSLIEDIAIRLLFKDQDGMNAFLDKIREGVGQRKVIRNVLVGSAIMGVLGYGLYSATKATSTPAAAQSVQISNNVIINIGAEQAGMKPEQLQSIIEAAVSDKKANARDAIEFVKPAKLDPAATISMEGKTVLAIPNETIKVVPSSLILDDSPTEKAYLDVDLQIRATNLDSRSSGWAALIPGLVDRRVKLVLAEGVDARQVAGRFGVRADIILHSRAQGASKEIKPYQITITRLVTN